MSQSNKPIMGNLAKEYKARKELKKLIELNPKEWRDFHANLPKDEKPISVFGNLAYEFYAKKAIGQVLVNVPKSDEWGEAITPNGVILTKKKLRQ